MYGKKYKFIPNNRAVSYTHLFANIALAGDLSGRGNTFDHGLAADYLRLVRDRDTPNARFFKKEGIKMCIRDRTEGMQTFIF